MRANKSSLLGLSILLSAVSAGAQSSADLERALQAARAAMNRPKEQVRLSRCDFEKSVARHKSVSAGVTVFEAEQDLSVAVEYKNQALAELRKSGGPAIDGASDGDLEARAVLYVKGLDGRTCSAYQYTACAHPLYKLGKAVIATQGAEAKAAAAKKASSDADKAVETAEENCVP